VRPTTRMEPVIAERFRDMLLAGMKQYGIRPGDLADHEHLDGRQIPRFNDERTIDCLCRGEGLRKRQSIVKLYEHAFEAGRSLSPEWAYRMLCILHATKKVAAWRAARDPGEDDWLWLMDHARLREPWGDGDPLVRDADAPAVGIPNKYAARHLARTLATLLAGTENTVHQKWIRRADEDGVAALLQQYFEDSREEMAANFSGWYNGAMSQYRVVVNDSKLKMTKLLIREGRTSKIVEVPSGGDPFEIHYAISRHAPKGDREPRPFEALYALLAHDLDQEARDRLKR